MGQLGAPARRNFTSASRSFLRAAQAFRDGDTQGGLAMLADDLASLSTGLLLAFTDVKAELNDIERKLYKLVPKKKPAPTRGKKSAAPK
jgi:hypothetical protein